MIPTRRSFISLAVVASSIALLACGSDATVDSGSRDSVPLVTEPADDPVVTTMVETTPIAVVDVVTDVGFYGACGNETFTIDGVTWYPVIDTIGAGESFDDTRYERPPNGSDVEGLLAVAEPEPGDDVGTLYVYEDGMGRFVSESERFDIWVTTEERTYDWVC